MEKAVLIRESDGKNIEYALEEGKPVVIGRGSDCDIKIPIDWISRRHAEINYKDDHYEIKDLGSSNGTSVNKDNIKNIPYKLKDNDKIILGGRGVLVFKLQPQPA